jgi:hypothetical protein
VYIGTSVKHGLVVRVIENFIYLFIHSLNDAVSSAECLYVREVRSIRASNWEAYLFIWLFNDAVSSAENITSNDGMIKEHIIRKDAETENDVPIWAHSFCSLSYDRSVASSKASFCPGICQGLWKDMKSVWIFSRRAEI